MNRSIGNPGFQPLRRVAYIMSCQLGPYLFMTIKPIPLHLHYSVDHFIMIILPDQMSLGNEISVQKSIFFFCHMLTLTLITKALSDFLQVFSV